MRHQPSPSVPDLRHPCFWPLKQNVPAEFSSSVAWSDDDVEKMLRLIEGGASARALARIMGRNKGDIEQQASFLGVLLPQHEAMPFWTRTTDSAVASATIHYDPLATAPRPRAL